MARNTTSPRTRSLRFAALVVSVLGIGCAAVLPTSGDLIARDAQLSSESELLAEGRVVAATQCATCHRLFGPAEYAPGEWGSIGRRMGRRAGIGHQSISALVRYMEEASRQERAGDQRGG